MKGVNYEAAPHGGQLGARRQGLPQVGDRRPCSQVAQGLGTHPGGPDYSLQTAGGPLPAPLLWDIVGLASATADAEWRRRFTALLLCFLVCRRSTEVLVLKLQDVSLLSDGAFHLPVRRFEGRRALLPPPLSLLRPRRPHGPI